MEIQSDVKIVQTDYVCPECKMGMMRPISHPLNSSWNTNSGSHNPNVINAYDYMVTDQPANYMHGCDNPDCNYQQFLDKTYPYIDYVNIDIATIHRIASRAGSDI